MVVEGHVPGKHLRVVDGAEELKLDDVASFMVIDFNRDAKRLQLSHSNVWKQEASNASSDDTKRKKRAPIYF